MARKSFQRGCLQWHRNQWSLLYWVKEGGNRRQKRESGAFIGCTDKKDKKAAKEIAREFLDPINRNKAKPKLLTFAEFVISRWASYVKKRNMEPSTLISYESIINRHLLPKFGAMEMAQITPGIVGDFFDAASRTLKPKTVTNIFALLNVMFDVAVEYELVELSPVRKRLHKPEAEKRDEKPTLEPQVISQILQRLPYAHRLFIAVIGILTVRVSEALALKWRNLDFQTRTLSLTHSVWNGQIKDTLKNKASKRKFVLPASMMNALASYRQQSKFPKADDFIFPNAVGGPIEPGNFRKRVLYPVMDELKIKREDRRHGFHVFRHSAATILHRETGDIEVAQRALGHSRRSTTEDVYDHVEVVVEEGVTQILLSALTDGVNFSPDNDLVN